MIEVNQFDLHSSGHLHCTGPDSNKQGGPGQKSVLLDESVE